MEESGYNCVSATYMYTFIVKKITSESQNGQRQRTIW